MIFINQPTNLTQTLTQPQPDILPNIIQSNTTYIIL